MTRRLCLRLCVCVVLVLAVFSTVTWSLRIDQMTMCGNFACANRGLLTVLSEEFSGASSCKTVRPEAETHSDHVVLRMKEIVPVTAVNVRGAAGVLYVKGKQEGAPWLKRAEFPHYAEDTYVFIRPYPSWRIKIDTPNPEGLVVSEVRSNCFGCRWAHEVSQPSVEDSTMSLTLPDPITLEAVEFELFGGNCDPSTVTITTSVDGVSYSTAAVEILSSIQGFPELRKQIVYLPTLVGVRYVKVIMLSDDGCGPVGLKAFRLGDSCTGGMPAGVDMMLVSHYKPATERQEAMEGMMRLLKFQAGFRDSWTRDRVLKEKDTLDRLWLGAPRLELGGQALEWVGGRKEVWRELADNDMKVRNITVGKAFLGRVANMAQHFEIYEEFYKNNVSVGLVLEDDSIFLKQFPSLLAKVIGEAPLPTDFDVIFIGGCLNKHAASYGGSKYSSLLWNIKQHRCANGYLITRRFLEKMLFSPWPRIEAWMNIDGFLESRMGTSIPLSMWSEPPIVYEASKALFSKGYTSLRTESADRSP